MNFVLFSMLGPLLSAVCCIVSVYSVLFWVAVAPFFNKIIILQIIKKLQSKVGKKTDTVVSKASSKLEPKKKVTKKNRVWDDSPPESKLDFTDPVDERGDENVIVVATDQEESVTDWEEVISSESDSNEVEGVEKKTKPNAKEERMVLIYVPGGMQFSDLQLTLKALKDRLMAKNKIKFVVGTALSTVYISGAPLVFIGCGQSYMDLKKHNVISIVKTLMK
ncbi:uncharacterized protein LOC131255373 [Magnolia sinica]|uniref:uncharacterized protein LOC131255373 n=1 Tax=Magnolia sinica TaxID=86752 RepID=UPI00265895C4|nr:uncharacterized protein LOC131255373 [Magnolia sinica]